jgi:hypothetical protein
MIAAGVPTMLRRQPLLALLAENEPAGALSPYQSGQFRKFSQKKQISPEDVKSFRHNVGMTVDKLVKSVDYNTTPKTLSYPDSAQIDHQVRKGLIPKRHHFATGLPDHMLKPMARTVRHLERLGIASGGRQDEKAAKIGYYRMTFHPDDDTSHGVSAAQRSRLAMDHIGKHYPELAVDHYKDELSDGRHVHHLEIPHHNIPMGIRHLKEWQEIVSLASYCSE